MITVIDKRQGDGEILAENCAPILLLGFNRPGLLEGLVAILSKARPPKIYLAVDGPRLDRPDEAGKCAECAAVMDTPGWPCEVRKLIRAENLGCKRAVEEALDWFFSQEDEGIILEDDCWPDISFLRYATELLERYRTDSRVGIVSGDNFYGFTTDPKSSYRFSRHVHIWGWATWARVWHAYRANPKEFDQTMDYVFKTGFFTSRGRKLAMKFWSDYLKRPDTWDVPFALWLHGHGSLTTMPKCNLVANLGGGNASGATHTRGFSYDEYLFARSVSLHFPLEHPMEIKCDIDADHHHEQRSHAWLPRLLTLGGILLGEIGRKIAKDARGIENVAPTLFRI